MWSGFSARPPESRSTDEWTTGDLSEACDLPYRVPGAAGPGELIVMINGSVAEPAAAPAVDGQTWKYWAFISYSHADESWARWLHRTMETYKVPKALAGTKTPEGAVRPRRLYPLFRDRDELSSASSLTANIRGALAGSRNLIVICSPRAAGSRWVNEEIRTFRTLGRGDRVFCLIVDGEPGGAAGSTVTGEECFPAALREVLAADDAGAVEAPEPIAADARPERDGKRNALLKLSAGILDVGFDSLKQRDHERRIRQFTIAGG